MANVLWIEPGTDATFGLNFFSSTSGSVASEAAAAFTGPRGILCDAGAGNAAAFVSRTAGLWTGASGRLSFRIRFVGALPDTGTTLLRLRNAGGSTRFTVTVQSGGVLQLAWAGGGGATATGNTVLAPDQWYRISLTWWGIVNSGAGASSIKVWLDGAPECEIQNAAYNGTSSPPAQMLVGYVTAPGASRVCHLDDFYTDDGDESTEGEPGDVRVTAKRPASVGNFSEGAPQGTAYPNRWETVAERPINATNRIVFPDGAERDETFGIEAAAVGDEDLTGAVLLARMPWMHGRVTDFQSPGSAYWDNGAQVPQLISNINNVYWRVVTTDAYPSAPDCVGFHSGSLSDFQLNECGMILAYRLPEAGDTLLISGIGGAAARSRAALGADRASSGRASGASANRGTLGRLRALLGRAAGTATGRALLRLLRPPRCYGGSVVPAVRYGGSVTLATRYGGSVVAANRYGGNVELAAAWGGTVLEAVRYGGSVEICGNE